MKPSLTFERSLLEPLTIFVSVANHLSFRAAADELGITTSAVSQSIRKLEARLGMQVLRRTTRDVGLTDAGRQLLDRSMPSLATLAEAVRTIRETAPEITGHLRINGSRPALWLGLQSIVREFCDLYPRASVELFSDDHLIDIVGQGFDAGVRTATRLEGDMVSVRLSAPFRFAVVARADYVKAHGKPKRISDLVNHRCIGLRPEKNSAPMRWEFATGRRRQSVAVTGQLMLNDWERVVDAAVCGFGFAYVPRPLAGPLIQSGELVSVLDDCSIESDGIFLYYPKAAHASATLKAFVTVARTHVRRLQTTGHLPTRRAKR